MPEKPITPEALDTALQLFGLDRSLTRPRLDAKRQELLATWNPHRYANLANNPKKYMQSYKKGEAMTKEIESAYRMLSAWLASQQQS